MNTLRAPAGWLDSAERGISRTRSHMPGMVGPVILEWHSQPTSSPTAGAAVPADRQSYCCEFVLPLLPPYAYL